MSILLKKKSISLLVFYVLGLIILFTALPICTANNIKAATGDTFYTQFSLYYERNCHQTTNYRKGILVPINTAVKFVKATDRSIFVTLPDSQELEIRNIEQYSGEGIDKIFSRTFAMNPVNLSVFTKDERESILLGEVKQGMRKTAVIAALGYPPKHKTPTLETDQWQYWNNRFNTFIVYFQNGKVSQVQD
jgi:hypothetical protein